MPKRSDADVVVHFIRRAMFLIEEEHLPLDLFKDTIFEEFQGRLTREFTDHYGEVLWYEWATAENENAKHRRPRG